MSEFTLYCYQCCPIRPDIPNDNNEEIFPDELEKADRKALDNMHVHQELIDKILTADLYRHFENRKENSRTGKYEMRLAFFYNNKRYFFKVLLPHKGSTGN